MSALQRARRSTSRTAPGPEADIAQPNGTISTSSAERPNPSPISSPPHPAAPAALLGLDPKSPTLSAAVMLSTLPVSNPLISEPPPPGPMDVVGDGFEDHADNGSSSLSELGDASDDDNSEPTPRVPVATGLIDPDSEAETERLENTPRKLKRTATDTSLISEPLYERTPSKLMHSRTVDEDDSLPTSPASPSVIAPSAPTVFSGLDALSSLAASEAASLEVASKKRKRASADDSSVDEATGEPARKRSGTAKDNALNGSQQEVVENAAQADVEEELDQAEEHISVLAQEEAELDERQADVAVETVSELAIVAKLTKPRKGGRRGKRKLEDAGGMSEAIANAETQDGEGDGDNDEEDNAVADEEVSKKKAAIDELAKIERKFKIFREKLCDEQILQCELELEMLKQPNCIHPEFLAMVQCLDERRDGKIAYEKQLMRYKQECLERTTVAQRHQLHSQYFQTVRDVRENILSECNQKIYELQRGRRQLGVEEIEYSLRLPEKRSDQIRNQTAYNLEVSILSGVAKYVGFPAAPEIKPARPSEVDDDLRAMKITARSAPQPVPYVRSYNRNATADEAAAEEQFIERTPWANPQHPVHQQTHFVAAGSRVPGQTYQTPAGQRRVVDIHAPNGSASTIEVHSNPPSSAAGPGTHNNGRMGDSESPVLQMKRNPSDHPAYNETPGSHPRTFAYASNPHPLSSPAVEPLMDDPGARWPGSAIRPLNAGTPSGPGRSVPLQRNNLGTVSVGSGNALFGR